MYYARDTRLIVYHSGDSAKCYTVEITQTCTSCDSNYNNRDNNHKISCCFLADRTNGRAIATLLRLSSSSSVVCLSVTLCIVAKRCVLEQKLLWRAYRKSYEKSIGTKMNDLDLCLEVVSRSRHPLHYI